MPGLMPGILQRSQHFQRQKHAERAVELAAIWYCIQMGAADKRREFRNASRNAAPNIRRLIGPNADSFGMKNGLQPLSSLQIGLGERRTVQPPACFSSDLSKLADRGLKP
ncbi:hypothetical protein D3C73_1355460 [compost metagenome]